MPDPKEISNYCSSLVAIVTGKRGKHEIQLAHFSVKEYLISDRLEGDIAQHFDETAARGSIAEVCLAYLLELDGNLSPPEIRRAYPMAIYPARYWETHAAAAENCNQTVYTLKTALLPNSSAFETCYRLYSPDVNRKYRPWVRNDTERMQPPPPALYYVSYTGLVYAARMLLEKGANINAQGEKHRNALQAASLKGNKDQSNYYLIRAPILMLRADITEMPSSLLVIKEIMK